MLRLDHLLVGQVAPLGQTLSGIAKALVTTAAGLFVAIPSLMFYRFFLRRVDDLVVMLEQEPGKLVNVVHGEREPERS